MYIDCISDQPDLRHPEIEGIMVMTSAAQTSEVPRDLKPALIKGLRLKCPSCGEGKLLHSYLKVNDSCSSCGEALHHQRADDGPAYLTILIVGHILAFAMHIMWSTWRPDPWIMLAILSTTTVVGALLMLPRMKGLIVAYQWAKRMHGF